jgi:hypothetical protein
MSANSKAAHQGSDRLTKWFFRLTGVVLLLLILVPFYRRVAGPDSDRIAGDVIEAADVSRTLFLLGTLIALTLGVLASRMIDASRFDGFLGNIGRRLVAIPLPWFAVSVAIISGLLCLVFSVTVLEGKPT